MQVFNITNCPSVLIPLTRHTISPARQAHSSKSAAAAEWRDRRTDRQTDGRPAVT